MAAVERVIEACERIVLQATDWDAFYEALLDPPTPYPELNRAAHRYRELVGLTDAGRHVAAASGSR